MREWNQDADMAKADLEAILDAVRPRLTKARQNGDIAQIVSCLRAMADTFNRLGNKKSAAEYLACAIKEIQEAKVEQVMKDNLLKQIQEQQEKSKIPREF